MKIYYDFLWKELILVNEPDTYKINPEFFVMIENHKKTYFVDSGYIKRHCKYIGEI